MTTFTESHARLSYKSYDPGNTGIDTDAFELVSESNRASGYRGFIFRNNITKDYVVAHTGTEFDTDKFRDGLLTDAQMWLMKVNQQLDDARSGGTGHQTSVTVLASPRPAIRWADPHACDLA